MTQMRPPYGVWMRTRSSGRTVGSAVRADDDTVATSLTYRLEGRDAALFTIDSRIRADKDQIGPEYRGDLQPRRLDSTDDGRHH